MENCKASPEINIPELLPDFDSPGAQGTWRQLFSVNIGRMVKVEITLFDGSLRCIVGELYAVGASWFAVSCGDKIILGDIFAIKVVTFC